MISEDVKEKIISGGNLKYHQIMKPLPFVRPKSLKDYVEIACQKAGNSYQLAMKIGTSQSNIHRVRVGSGSFRDDIVVRLANYLEVDPIHLLLITHTEWAEDAAKAYWETMLSGYDHDR
jgi:hypothetical protein